VFFNFSNMPIIRKRKFHSLQTVFTGGQRRKIVQVGEASDGQHPALGLQKDETANDSVTVVPSLGHTEAITMNESAGIDNVIAFHYVHLSARVCTDSPPDEFYAGAVILFTSLNNLLVF
jgi:hypothetical protein